jgi:hypothetical protein
MSGLEVVAAVTGIISAFNGSLTIYRDWREKKRERKENARNQNLELSLIRGSNSIQEEYDRDFARLGRRFAVGDGKAPYLCPLLYGFAFDIEDVKNRDDG